MSRVEPKFSQRIICFIILCLMGCSHSNEKVDDITYPVELLKVEPLLKEKKYLDARYFLDEYLNKATNLDYFGHAYFLKGYIFELEGNSEQAISFYRQAIEHSLNFNSLIEAKALYNLSFTYERQGDFAPLMTVLTDLVKRSQYFKPLTAQVEIPARMGAALASLGQMDRAKVFHNKATAAYRELSRSGSFRPSPLDLSKALYYLGVAVYPVRNESFSNLAKKIEWGQEYLLASAESSKGSWALKSSRKLTLSYQKLWKLMVKKDKGKTDKKAGEDSGLDPLAKKRALHTRQLEQASDFFDLVDRVRAQEFPLEKVNMNSKQIVAIADLWRIKLKKFAMKLDLGPETVRSKALANRPLMKEGMDIISVTQPKVNKEISEEQLGLPPPIGFEKSAIEKLSFKPEKENDQKKSNQALNQEAKNNARKDLPRESMNVKKEMDKLPEKDPNL